MIYCREDGKAFSFAGKAGRRFLPPYAVITYSIIFPIFLPGRLKGVFLNIYSKVSIVFSLSSLLH